MSEFNLKPVNNQTAINIMNQCWNGFYKKYSAYNNASYNNDLHFSEKTWDEILGYRDEAGEFQKGIIDKLYDEMPCEFTSNICLAILKELEARDRGGYNDVYHGHEVFEGSHVLSKVNAILDRDALKTAPTDETAKDAADVPPKEDDSNDDDAFH